MTILSPEILARIAGPGCTAAFAAEKMNIPKRTASKLLLEAGALLGGHGTQMYRLPTAPRWTGFQP